MHDVTIGTITCVSFNTPISGWLPCDGSLISISGNNALFVLIGTTYGGDGKINFALPDLRGRAPRHTSSTKAPGTVSGEESVQLTPAELPAHTHTAQASSAPASLADPNSALLSAAAPRGIDAYSAPGPTTPLAPNALSNSGADIPHENRQPFLAMNYRIAVQGTFPSPGSSSPFSDPFLGEIRLFACHQIPKGWLPCDGQSVDEYAQPPLYSLIGTTYGSQSSGHFNLPDLRGRLILGTGKGPSSSNYTLGQSGGQEAVTLDPTQIPSHTHQPIAASAAPSSAAPAGNLLSSQAQIFNSVPTNNLSLAKATVLPAGGSLPHDNMMPFLTLTYCICVDGIYPH